MLGVGIDDRSAVVAATGRSSDRIEQFSLVHFNISDESTEVAGGTGDAARINAPTLVLLGDRDTDATRANARTTVEDTGENADLVVLSDCGHSPLIDDLDRFLDEVTDFLEP